jgi:hypothetical protein
MTSKSAAEARTAVYVQEFIETRLVITGRAEDRITTHEMNSAIVDWCWKQKGHPVTPRAAAISVAMSARWYRTPGTGKSFRRFETSGPTVYLGVKFA